MVQRKKDGDSDSGPRVRRSRGPVVCRLKPGVILLVCLVAAMLAGAGSFAYRVLYSGGPSDGPVTVTVDEGEGLSEVSGALKKHGAVGSAKVFELQARVEGLGTEIKPGKYRIAPGESGQEILRKMTTGGGIASVQFTIPEGLTLDQIAGRVADQSGVSAASFRRAARSTDYGYGFLQGKNVRSTEGFLFPKKYDFTKETTARQMVTRMLQQYSTETRGLPFQRAPKGPKDRRLTEYQIITVASLIEREAASDGERPIIASVIYNRLQKGMPLQIDATVQYALGVSKQNLSLQDLKVQSPYNTYERTGLPPGPIASPGLPSIRAALNPADTKYLYYVLKRNGKGHTFTKSYERFLRAKKNSGR